MESDPRFSEWMINNALHRHLQPSIPENMNWLFGVKVRTSQGDQELHHVCGFNWHSAIDWAYDTGLDPENDRGKIELSEFRKTYWGIRPDFRFWTANKEGQLIIEGKGRNCQEKKDFPQANRYFRYLGEYPSRGALVYLVPEESEPETTRWVQLLVKAKDDSTAADDCGIQFGVLSWTPDFLRTLGHDLTHVIAESLIEPAKLLARALDIVRNR